MTPETYRPPTWEGITKNMREGAKYLKQEELERSGDIVPEKKFLTNKEKNSNEKNLRDDYEIYEWKDIYYYWWIEICSFVAI